MRKVVTGSQVAQLRNPDPFAVPAWRSPVYRTPGLIVATHDLLRRVGHPSDEQIREALAGNICRCTGYAKIIQAVHEAAAG